MQRLIGSSIGGVCKCLLIFFFIPKKNKEMIINQNFLLEAEPISPMVPHKVRNPDALTSYGMSETGYDVRIRQDLEYDWNGGNPEIHWYDPVTGEHGTKKGNFILASTVEQMQLPCTLAGIVHDKSTLARLGVAVQNTVIEPGFHGGLTLEITFHEHNHVHIVAGSGIAQIVFHTVAKHIRYDGKYQNQDSKPVGAIKG